MANEPLRRLSRGALQALLAAEDGTSLPPWPQRLDPPAALALSMTGRYGQGLDGFELEYQNGRLYAWPFAGGHRMRLRMEGERLVSDGLLHSGQSWRWRNENGQVSLQSGTESDPKLWPRQAEEAPPPRLPPRWQDLLGDYGWDHNTLTVLERNGSLFVLIEWFFLYPLTEIGEDDFRFPSWGLYADEGLRFQRDDSGRVQAVLVGPVRFLRRPAAERENQARLSPESLEALRSTLPAATPPTGDRSDPIPDWVDLATLDPTLDLEIRYAGNQNPLGTAVYPQAKAFLQKQAAEALARVHQRLRPLGYGLLVLDAYQPWSVTRLIWHATPAEFRSFVAEPKTGSRHNRGMAVDLSLVRLTDGQEVTMPSNYGQYDSAAHPFFPGTTSLQRWHRDLLRRFMEAEGFTVHPNKWWQFDYQGWRDWPLFDQSFDQIRASMAETD
ncbi:MAG: hypothetical protein DWQ01_01875 [Planctomycetota bacterium]|nr:MAG: hypothetical protein DWQ01_01875 [Planctomycetota bacterium]